MFVVFADCFEPCAGIGAFTVAYSNAEYNMNFKKSQQEIRKIDIKISYCAALDLFGVQIRRSRPFGSRNPSGGFA
jgi:hypothetical protein